MTSYVVDSWAWIEYLDGTAKGSRVRALVEGDSDIHTTASSLAEVASKAKRVGKDPNAAARRISSLSRFAGPTFEDATAAGILHAQTRQKVPNFSLADAFVLRTARRLGAKVLTGDPDFRAIEEAELIG